MSNVGISWTSEEVAARSGVFHLLARLWLREVDTDLLHELRSPTLGNAFEVVGGIIPDGDPSTLAQLEIDYCQLFVGPANHLPPMQSVWESGQFCGDSVVSMKQFVDVVGYDPGAFSGGVSLDHLGIQFDVMAHILGQIQKCSFEDTVTVIELARSYAQTHLYWPTRLLDLAERQAATEFYRSVIKLTRDFLDSELE